MSDNLIKADLHVHTTASDGIKTPSEIVKIAKSNNLNAIAITDHDTIEGLNEAIETGNYLDILVIPGIEFSCSYEDLEVHVLGLFIDYKNKLYNEITNKLKLHRLKRTHRIIEKLNALGMDISIDEVNKLCNNSIIGRPHIARILVDKGYVSNIDEAFKLYLDKGRVAYFPRFKITINEAIEIIQKSNGISVIAHPGIYNIDINHLLNQFNFDGIEVYHSKHKEEQECVYRKIALERNLIITGGSDYHGDCISKNIYIGCKYVDLTLQLKNDKLRNYIINRGGENE